MSALVLAHFNMGLEVLLIPVLGFLLLALLLSLAWVVRVYWKRLPDQPGERLRWVDAWVSAKASAVLTLWLSPLICLGPILVLEPDLIDWLLGLLPLGMASLGGTLFLALFLAGLAIIGRRPLDRTQAGRLLEVDGAVVGVSVPFGLVSGILVSVALGPSQGLMTLTVVVGLAMLACFLHGVPRTALVRE